MSIKVKEVLELAQSKGCTLAAGEGGMDRIVRFVDCMEIPDMKAWMRPNVLYITTGYAYSDTKEEIMNLIRNLYEAKAAALATKYRYIGCFLDDAIKLANELQFPIIFVAGRSAFHRNELSCDGGIDKITEQFDGYHLFSN